MTRPARASVETAGKVLAKAQLFDARVVTDPATILAWAEVLQPTRLTLDDLLPAVVVHYSTSTTRVMPADVIRIGRERRRDRQARSGEHLEAIAAAGEAKGADSDELAQRRKAALERAVGELAGGMDVNRAMR